MTPAPGLAGSRHLVLPVAVVGCGARGRAAGAALLAAGISEFVIFDKAPEARLSAPAPIAQRLRPGQDVITSVFDDTTDTWELNTASGEVFRARVVIAAHRSVLVPWIPHFAGRGDFRGESFHAAAWAADFDPAGKHIAVIGTDAAAGHYLGQLVEQAASVTVFAQAPRRIVTELPFPMTRAKRWLRRHLQGARPAPVLVGSAIDAVTSSGIRTSDGVDHRADAIIFGTGFAIADQTPDESLVGARGLTIRQAWADGMEPCFGVAVHGFPNYFIITGPDIGAQARYVAECVKLMKHTASTRIEVRLSSQKVFNERAQLNAGPPHPVASAFDLSSRAAEDNETYDGPATLTLAGTCHRVRVRLTGHLNPIDGNYHWQGTIIDALPADSLKQPGLTTLTVGEHSVTARIVERTPWGTHSVAGVGAPPYAGNGGCTDPPGS